MLVIKAYLDRSNISGIGLFANQDIKKDTIIWRYNPIIDIYFTKEQFNTLSKDIQDFILEYGSLSKITNKYILSIDNSRFINHSFNPNLDVKRIENEPELVSISNRDIKRGEELTINYKMFDLISSSSNSGYLKE